MDPIDFLRRQGLVGGILGHGSCSGSKGIPAQEACECNGACVFDHTVGKGKAWVHGGKKVGSDMTGWRLDQKSTRLNSSHT